MAKYKNKTSVVLSFSIGEKALRMEFIIFPGESAELPDGNSYIASIEAQGFIELIERPAENIEPPRVGRARKQNTNLKKE
jgi:hypothetical protein